VSPPEPAISRRRSTAATAPRATDGPVPVVGSNQPCPCGSGRKYKACHGKGGGDDRRLTARPFEGLSGEVEWVALREIVPAATASLTLAGDADREVLLTTLLPLAWPALVRSDGRTMLGLQVPTRSGDVSRDLAWALEQALETTPGNPVQLLGLPGPGPRLQDLLAGAPLEVTVHDGFDFWVEGAADPTGEVAASMERANASVVPTARVGDQAGAYWCRMRERSHLRWVLPHAEEPALDALARLAAGPGLSLGEGTRYVGSFRAHGLLVPVWDLPLEQEADSLVEPVAALRARLEDELASPRALTSEERRARSGLLSRQLTLR
jgi:hypothetical protein